MPKSVENKLRKEAIARRLRGKRKNAYVYGTMNKMGLMHGNETISKDGSHNGDKD